uniref:Uncharacterized protein n=1 Tax=Chenopodium quinoa TaxID=63459 RepID=A0A803NEL9_CHEQI
MGLPSQSNSPPTSFSVGNENSAAVVPEKQLKSVIVKRNDVLLLVLFSELQKHAQEEHPDSRPSKIDPARQLDWDNFSSSHQKWWMFFSTIHSEVPRGVVLGDYVIEYGDDDTADEFEDFPGDEGNWWTSCILYQNFQTIEEMSLMMNLYTPEVLQEVNFNRRSSRRRRSRFYDH